MESIDNNEGQEVNIESLIEEAKQKIEEHLREIRNLAAAHEANPELGFGEDLESEEDRGVELLNTIVEQVRKIGEAEGARRRGNQGQGELI